MNFFVADRKRVHAVRPFFWFIRTFGEKPALSREWRETPKRQADTRLRPLWLIHAV